MEAFIKLKSMIENDKNLGEFNERKYIIEFISNKNIDKKYLAEELQKRDFISDILFLFQKYFDDNQIIFEGLWIFINISFFLKNATDLSLYLTNKNCINIYIMVFL